MQIALIVAMANNRVIGMNNKLPWYLPADLRRFREITMGNPILMGRKTFDSIGRPLPGRTNVVITHNKDLQLAGCIVFHSLEEALDQLKDHQTIMVIGGARLYKLCFPLAQRIYLTLVHHQFKGDTYFPEIDLDIWSEVERQDILADSKNQYDHSFLVYHRK